MRELQINCIAQNDKLLLRKVIVHLHCVFYSVHFYESLRITQTPYSYLIVWSQHKYLLYVGNVLYFVNNIKLKVRFQK